MSRSIIIGSVIVLLCLFFSGVYWYMLPSSPSGVSRVSSDIGETLEDQKCATIETLSVLVDGNSMEGIITAGSTVKYLSGAYSCGESVKRGDIVVVSVGDKLLVKRVVGLGGDSWTYSGGTVTVSDTVLSTTLGEPYQLRSPLLERLTKSYPIIPSDSVLILGNKVGGSLDSSVFGLFGKRDLRGRVEL